MRRHFLRYAALWIYKLINIAIWVFMFYTMKELSTDAYLKGYKEGYQSGLATEVNVHIDSLDVKLVKAETLIKTE